MTPLIFSILLSLSGNIDPLSPYRFQPISEVVIDAPEGFNEADLRALIGLTPGQLVHSKSIQKAVKRIYQLGTIQDVQVRRATRRRGQTSIFCRTQTTLWRRRDCRT